ncbi:hypothetical protein AMELA_G00223710 [Ameiurus melas]|uniref:Uncharacterized protein n=1 Tax=Ameiurus melas TaxID=219545 RepID=A0A7J5ZYZ4_AMEME|nr:hypothetical protein AMELA_G00223710 [Ameiurus melas]
MLTDELRVSFAVCFGSLFCLKVHPHLIFIILVDGIRFFLRISCVRIHSSCRKFFSAIFLSFSLFIESGLAKFLRYL